MTGDAASRTIPDGSAILVNTAGTDRRDGGIALVRTGDHEIVRGLIHDPEAGWLLHSDNADKTGWPTEPWRDNATIVGEVRWLGRTFI